MNENQKKLLKAVVAAVVAMLIFPPFQARLPSGIVSNLGYHAIFQPPSSELLSDTAGSVDIAMLFAQWVGVLIVGAIAFVLLRDEATFGVSEMSKRLSAYFDHTLRASNGERITVGDELTIVADYLEIKRLRMKVPLNFTITADDDTRAMPISNFLILAPIVKNLLKLRSTDKAEGGVIEITARTSTMSNGRRNLHLIIEDTNFDGSAPGALSAFRTKVGARIRLAHLGAMAQRRKGVFIVVWPTGRSGFE